MQFKFLIPILAILLITSCSVSPQYKVYVENQTDDNITISYLEGDMQYDEEEQKILESNERALLISSPDIKNRSGKTSAEDCKLIAQYIRATNSKGKTSSISWCSAEVRFEVVDIGQGEFTLTYTTDSFIE